MIFSNAFVRNMERALLKQYLTGGPTYLTDVAVANKHSHNIILNKEDIIYVPVAIKNPFDRSLGDMLANGTCSSIEIPLYDELYSPLREGEPARVFRRTEEIMNYLLTSKAGLRLCEINTGATKYHMSPTMIFNSDWELIYYVALEYRLQRYAKQDSRYMFTNNAKMFINPVIFKKEGMLEKFIVNKILPYYTNKDDRYDTLCNSGAFRMNAAESAFLKSLTITAEVKDLSYIIKNYTAYPKLDYNEEINDMLAKYASELADIMTE